jgi:hypothetical protein
VTYPVADRDDAWSLGIHSVNGLPDDAVRACMDVWRWSLLHSAFHTPFTVRTARWVSKLRWLDQAGGSASGAVTNASNLWFIASTYAAREKHVEAVDDKKGMRSPIIDIDLVLSETERKLAKDLGLLDEWGAADDTVDLMEEFMGIAPEVVAHAKEMEETLKQVDAMPSEQAEFFKAFTAAMDLQGMLDTFGEEGTTERKEGEALIKMVTGAVYRDPRWPALEENDGAMFALRDVLTDLRNAQSRDNEKAERGEERDQLSTWDARAQIDEVLDGYQAFTIDMLLEHIRSYKSAGETD